MPSNYTFKLITAGDGGVGKTTMLYRYVEGKFKVDTKMTIGVGFFYKTIDLGDENNYSLQLWDFGGEEHFRALLNSYVSGASGAFLMIDLTRMNSLNKIEQWVEIIRQEDKNLPILLVGSKLDLEEKISVKDEDALKLKEKYNFTDFIKISSKTGQNVNDVFIKILTNILEYQKLK
jgi:small GTP-binding protein